MNKVAKELHAAVDSVMEEAVAIRRHLHRHPELSGAEQGTARFVADRCRKLGLPLREHVGGHGLVARLQHDADKPWVALRADMDALPIQDGKPCNYRSMHDGISHACGHDVHTAIQLATIDVLTRMEKSLPCNVLFIFQPAEETTEGAESMLRDGCLESIRPQRIYALHVYPYLPAGSIGLREGAMCAAADSFEVTIQGRGGHAARPHECIDVILVASHIVQSLHHIVSRRINPLHPAVLTIGQIQGGHAPNVIPESVTFSGTVRSLDTSTHEEIRTRMDHIIRQTAEAWGATASFRMQHAAPVLHNDAKIVGSVRETLQQWSPETSLIDIDEPSMGGEDFAEFLQHAPGCLLRLGTGSSPETRYPLHHPCFDIDEQAMRHGIITMASLCLNHRGL